MSSSGLSPPPITPESDRIISAQRDGNGTHSVLMPYGLAVASAAGMGLVRLSMQPWLDGRAPFQAFLPAVLFAAWRGGTGPGLLAMAIGAAGGAAMMQPRYPWAAHPVDNSFALCLYLVAAIMIVVLAEAQRNAASRAAAHADAAEAERDRLQITLQSLGDAVITTDETGRVTFLNPTAERLTGWQQRDAIGRDCTDVFHIIHQHTGQEVESPLARVKRERIVVGLANHTILVSRDGTKYNIDDSGAPLFDRQGRLQGMVLVFHDITERRKMEDAARESDIRFRALADNISQLAWIADATGHIFWYNRRWYEYTGTTLEEMEGWGWKNVHHPDHIDRVVERWSAHLRAGEFFEDIFPLRNKEGEYRRFLTRASPVRDETDQIVRWCGTNTDVEDIERAQEAIQRHMSDIETLNVQLRRAMTETHHRVRNNLQVLSAMIDMQAGDHAEMLPVSEFVRLSQHLQALSAIHTLLTDQAKQAGDARTVAIHELLDKLLPLYEKVAGGRVLRFHTDEVTLPTRQATAFALITNELLSNALKHGRADVEVILAGGDGTARLGVRDEGSGFPPGFDPERAAHTGIELITSLARWDLQGDVHFGTTEKGTASVVVTFPIPESPPEEKSGLDVQP